MMMMIALEIHLENSHVLSRIRKIFIETLNKKFTEFSMLENFVKLYITPYLSEF